MRKLSALPIVLLLPFLLSANPAASHHKPNPQPATASPANPVAAYRSITQRCLASCAESSPFSHSTSVLERAPDGYRACIDKARSDSAATVDAALEAAKRPESRAALAKYHAAFLAALDAIAPKAQETAEAHRLRFHALLHNASHAWARFEMLD